MQYNKIIYQVVHVKDGHGLSGFNSKSYEEDPKLKNREAEIENDLLP